MKRYTYDFKSNSEKFRGQRRQREHKSGGFTCSHCRQFVIINALMGTTNRNHCNSCLWSKHVDIHTGDRRATCYGGMQPIGLTFKHEGYGKQGEVMLIHLCSRCQKISLNRIARDDDDHKIVATFEYSFGLPKNIKIDLVQSGVNLLTRQDKEQLSRQLFGTE